MSLRLRHQYSVMSVPVISYCFTWYGTMRVLQHTSYTGNYLFWPKEDWLSIFQLINLSFYESENLRFHQRYLDFFETSQFLTCNRNIKTEEVLTQDFFSFFHNCVLPSMTCCVTNTNQAGSRAEHCLLQCPVFHIKALCLIWRDAGCQVRRSTDLLFVQNVINSLHYDVF